jgi:hypothetical protein
MLRVQAIGLGGLALLCAYLTSFAVVESVTGAEQSWHLAVLFGLATRAAARASLRRFRTLAVPRR